MVWAVIGAVVVTVGVLLVGLFFLSIMFSTDYEENDDF